MILISLRQYYVLFFKESITFVFVGSAQNFPQRKKVVNFVFFFFPIFVCESNYTVRHCFSNECMFSFSIFFFVYSNSFALYLLHIFLVFHLLFRRADTAVPIFQFIFFGHKSEYSLRSHFQKTKYIFDKRSPPSKCIKQS